ncbi:hypothetical protein Dda_0324 [Drechslerella dactyloides]|uniref:Uncharacterized protein n=1 Tax=Drechslerella dactyloides TaxID=74499 RepID=A0AAD6J5K6_DREDA|nr:hypothetical protein Dda_0324 [Drechslerella dactyloides]
MRLIPSNRNKANSVEIRLSRNSMELSSLQPFGYSSYLHRCMFIALANTSQQFDKVSRDLHIKSKFLPNFA